MQKRVRLQTKRCCCRLNQNHRIPTIPVKKASDKEFSKHFWIYQDNFCLPCVDCILLESAIGNVVKLVNRVFYNRIWFRNVPTFNVVYGITLCIKTRWKYLPWFIIACAVCINNWIFKILHFGFRLTWRPEFVSRHSTPDREADE